MPEINDFFKNMHNWCIRLGAQIGGNMLVNIYGVDYKAADQDIGDCPRWSGIKIRIDTKIADSFVDPAFSGIDLYSVVCDHDYYTEGDVFTPVSKLDSASILTITDARDKDEHVGLRTDRLGSLCTSAGPTPTVIYDNVYFDFYASPTEGKSEYTQFPDQDSPRKQRKRAAMYQRAGIGVGHRLIDQETGFRYTVTSVHGTGQLMVLFLEE